jgi:hypothetical protein
VLGNNGTRSVPAALPAIPRLRRGLPWIFSTLESSLLMSLTSRSVSAKGGLLTSLSASARSLARFFRRVLYCSTATSSVFSRAELLQGLQPVLAEALSCRPESLAEGIPNSENTRPMRSICAACIRYASVTGPFLPRKSTPDTVDLVPVPSSSGGTSALSGAFVLIAPSPTGPP